MRQCNRVLIGATLSVCLLGGCGGTEDGYRGPVAAEETKVAAPAGFSDLGRIAGTIQFRGGLISFREAADQIPTVSAERAYDAFVHSQVAAHYPEMKRVGATISYGLLTVDDYGQLGDDGTLKRAIESAPAFLVVVEGAEVLPRHREFSYSAATTTGAAAPKPLPASALVAVDATTGAVLYQYVGESLK